MRRTLYEGRVRDFEQYVGVARLVETAPAREVFACEMSNLLTNGRDPDAPQIGGATHPALVFAHSIER
jgi:hypothetical protein